MSAAARPSLTPLPRVLIEPLVQAALAEDLGRAGDITSQAVIPDGAQAQVVIAARQPGTLAGIDLAGLAFTLMDPAVIVRDALADGTPVQPGAVLARISGPARAILSAERTALNFLGHLSGIATATAALVAETAGTKAQIVCTRKTTPGLRLVEKYAVRAGGGLNHRFGLDDAILIKDNHIAVAGSIAAALQAAKTAAGHMVRIEIECDTLDQLREALNHGADVILLDNMTPDQLREAVTLTAGRAVLEASGTITRETVRAVAQSGVDMISSGAITHSAPNFDIGLDIEIV